MNVVGPLGRMERRSASPVAAKPTGLVGLILENQMNLSARNGFADALCQFLYEVRLAVI
jgi:hypothetical protein